VGGRWREKRPPMARVALRCPFASTMGRRFENVTGFLLAGGASRRMGRPKAALVLGGETMLGRQIRLLRAVSRQVFIVGAAARSAGGVDGPVEDFGVTTFPDELPGRGPLAGIATALARTRTEFNLILSCDLPWMEAALLRLLCRRAFMGGAEVTLPISRGGREEPLCAVYRRRVLWAVRTTLAAGQGKVSRLFSKVRVERLEWREFARAGFPVRIFDNMNTPEDYEAAKRRLSVVRTLLLVTKRDAFGN
jgi:molybdenum cofactor guanylyltransferase